MTNLKRAIALVVLCIAASAPLCAQSRGDQLMYPPITWAWNGEQWTASGSGGVATSLDGYGWDAGGGFYENSAGTKRISVDKLSDNPATYRARRWQKVNGQWIPDGDWHPLTWAEPTEE